MLGGENMVWQKWFIIFMLVIHGINVLIDLIVRCDPDFKEENHKPSFYAFRAVIHTVYLVLFYFVYKVL